MTPVTALDVAIQFGGAPIPVGRLALRDRRIYFQYEPSFVARALPISPVNLPLRPDVTLSPHPDLFEGLHGVFNDSLPDGWGRLLFDRAMRARGTPPGDLGPLDRLAYVGSTGMGALVYTPMRQITDTPDPHPDLNSLALHAQNILDGADGEPVDDLLAVTGSSAGARPKALLSLNAATGRFVAAASGEQWLVKFATTQDGADARAVEHVYALMARQAGISVMPTRLLPGRQGPHFATKRFDRNGATRLHVLSACGLLDADFRVPALDYTDLVRATLAVTHDAREVEKLYRIACFNVLARNRDDHSKNFAFLMDATGHWTLAPAYDITFSSGPAGQHSTLVMGEGLNPGRDHLLALAVVAGLEQRHATHILERTRDALSTWPTLAREHGVSPSTIQFISNNFTQ